MLRMLSDEDVPGDIVRGLLRRQPNLDVVRVQEAALRDMSIGQAVKELELIALASESDDWRDRVIFLPL